MKKPKYQIGDRRVEECKMCEGYGFIGEYMCDWCDGTGRITETQLSQYLSEPAFEDWKFARELRAIDDMEKMNEPT